MIRMFYRGEVMIWPVRRFPSVDLTLRPKWGRWGEDVHVRDPRWEPTGREILDLPLVVDEAQRWQMINTSETGHAAMLVEAPRFRDQPISCLIGWAFGGGGWLEDPYIWRLG